MADNEIVARDILKKLTYEIPPLTMRECRWLYEEAFGLQDWPRSTRCSACGGAGVRWVTLDVFRHEKDELRPRRLSEFRECPDCWGKGYLEGWE